jgi:uncharacterized membrane protein YdbT with pleckstrin-like domain
LAAHRLQLPPGEKVLVDIRPHWSFLSAPLAVSLAAIAIGVALDIGIPHTSVTLHWVEGLAVAVPCAWLAVRVVRWRTTGLMVTSQRIVERWGVVSRRQAETRLDQIATVTVIRSLLRQIVGTGRLELETWDEEVRWIHDVRKPVILQRVINRRLGPRPQPQPQPGTELT